MLNNTVRVMRGPLSEVLGWARVFLISCRLDPSEVSVRKHRKNNTSFLVRLQIAALPLTSCVPSNELFKHPEPHFFHLYKVRITLTVRAVVEIRSYTLQAPDLWMVALTAATVINIDKYLTFCNVYPISGCVSEKSMKHLGKIPRPHPRTIDWMRLS